MNPMRILMVEDVAVIQKMNELLLQQLGFTADFTHCAEEALAMFEQNPYDLVITDIGLPSMDGITLAKKIRKYEKRYCTQQAKIYVLTAYDLEDVQKECLVADVDGAYNKPIKTALLMQMIKSSRAYQKVAI